MKKFLLVILLILFSFCSSEVDEIKEASDIIPKSEVIWCNNQLNKLKKVIDQNANGENLGQIYTETQLESLSETFDYFSATTELFYGSSATERLILVLRVQLNSNVDEYSDKEGQLQQIIESADFCNSWYQAQN